MNPVPAPYTAATAATATPPRTVLVLGASGRLGAAAVAAFAEAGWRVLAQSRRPLHGLPPGVAAVRAGLDEHDAIADAARALGGAAVLLHAVNPPYTRWTNELLPAARAALTLAGRLGSRFLLPDNVYAFGESMPPVLDERTPLAPSTEKGRLRATLDAEVAAWAGAGAGRQAVSIRAGDFYGAGRGAWLDLVITKPLPQGRLVRPGPADVAHAFAYVPDLARAFVAVASRPVDAAAAPHLRLGFAGHTLTLAQLLDEAEAAARTLGIVPPGTRIERRALPWPLLRAGGLVVPMWRELARMRYLWEVPHRIDGSALERFAGPLPTTPPAAAIRASLAELFLSSPRPAASGPVPSRSAAAS
jgi:nucleoside-diphosphate-sugar epimerase